MTAATAAAYADERSVESFRRGVGSLYPKPHNVRGKGKRWLIEEMDAAISRATGKIERVKDASDVL
jgi:hypothetical protein